MNNYCCKNKVLQIKHIWLWIANLKTIIFITYFLTHAHAHIQIHIKHKTVWVCFCFSEVLFFYELSFNLPFICSNILKFYLCMYVCSVVQWCLTLCHPMDCSPPGCPWNSREEYWSGLPFPPPEDLPNPGIEPVSLGLLHQQAGSLPLHHLRYMWIYLLLLTAMYYSTV